MNPQLIEQPAREQAELPQTPYDCWRTYGGDVATEFYRTGGGYLVRICGLVDFVIDLAAERVICTPVPGVPAEQVADLYFNQALPLLMGVSGDLVIHASGVAVRGQALGFIGPTGRGKSTLAASFARMGHPFLTDDGLILDCAGQGYEVRPRRPILRLRPDSEAMIAQGPAAGMAMAGEMADADDLPFKTRVAARADIPFHETAVPLAALYVLVEPADVAAPVFERLAAPAALSALMQHSFILDVEDKARLRGLFGRLALLAEAVPCFALDYPRRYDALPSVLDAIIEHGATGAEPT